VWVRVRVKLALGLEQQQYSMDGVWIEKQKQYQFIYDRKSDKNVS